MSQSPDELSRLKEQLAEAFQREGEFRLKSARDLAAAGERLRVLEQALAARDTRIHELHQAAAERDRYVHQLHLEQIELRNAVHALHGDLETFTWMLHEHERAGPPATPDLPGAPFTYHLHTSPYRIYRGDRFTLRGWALPEDGRAITAIRVRVDEKAFPGRSGLPEPVVIAQYGPQPQNPHPGFEIDFAIPPGRHRLRLEACLEARDWLSILNLPIWRQQ